MSSTKRGKKKQKEFNNQDIAFVKGVRKRLGYKQEDFARMIGVDRSTYAKKEKGRIPLDLREWIKIVNEIKKEHPAINISCNPDDIPPPSLAMILPETLKIFPVLEKIITASNEAAKNHDKKFLIKILEYASERMKDEDQKEKLLSRRQS